MKIALLTCEKLPELTLADQLLIPELAKYNIEATAVIWDDDTINWTHYDCLIFRNTWDYYEKETEFNNWLNHIKSLQIKTLNTLDTIYKNKHKFYLKNIQNLGIQILPTIFIEKTNTLNLQEILPNHWEKIIIKPAFSAGSYFTTLFEKSDIEKTNQHYSDFAKDKELLIQKYFPEIETLGETSFVFFNKKFSHCINKKPVTGDFRIQVQFGGKYTSIEPSIEIIAKAQRIVIHLKKIYYMPE
jgi:glutathione synthase/RimK-type ligase-like ATP-grasp enzyme